MIGEGIVLVVKIDVVSEVESFVSTVVNVGVIIEVFTFVIVV